MCLKLKDPKDDMQLNRVFEEITKALNIRADELIKKDKHSIQLIAYAGYAAASAVQQLSDEQVLGGKVLFASNNHKRLFDTKEKVENVDWQSREWDLFLLQKGNLRFRPPYFSAITSDDNTQITIAYSQTIIAFRLRFVKSMPQQ